MRFVVAKALQLLRKDVGDSEFGYRMQGFLAHVFLGLGGSVLQVNAQGHPDVKARLGERVFLIQVKACSHSSPTTMFNLTHADFLGITSTSGDSGFLAFLDCAAPARWILVPEERARALVDRPVHVASLEADADRILSSECTEVFGEIVSRCEARLNDLTFSLLKKRAAAKRPV